MHTYTQRLGNPELNRYTGTRMNGYCDGFWVAEHEGARQSFVAIALRHDFHPDCIPELVAAVERHAILATGGFND